MAARRMFGSGRDTLVQDPMRQAAWPGSTRRRPGADSTGPETPQCPPASTTLTAPHAPTEVARLIDARVAPRLLLAHAPTMAETLAEDLAGLLPGPTEVAALSALVLADNLSGATAFVEGLLRDGTAPDVLYLDLLAPTARRLGAFWQEDTCDFTQVTLGLVHLQHLLRVLGPAFHAAATRRDRGVMGGSRQILLCPLPGQQHSFGLSMVAEFFRRAGWSVAFGLEGPAPDIAAVVRRDWFAVVGFSASCDEDLRRLPMAIRAVRQASCNKRVGILVGGPVFAEHPEYARDVGADASAADARQATLQAERLLALLVRPA